MSDKEISNYAKEFSKIVLNKIIKAPDVPGVNDFLKKYYKTMTYFIITGTPTSEMKLIAKRRRIEKYFKGVYGSPTDKDYWTKHIITNSNLDPNKIIFIGDAMSDYIAAKSNKTHFALRVTNDNVEIFKNYNVNKFNNYIELEKIIMHIK